MRTLVLSLLAISVVPTTAVAMTAEQVYDAGRDAINRLLPADMMADVSGVEIDRSLSEIPSAGVADPAAPLRVRFYYKKHLGQRLLVLNTSELYRSRFSGYLSLFDPYDAFSDPRSNYARFTAQYRWEVISESPSAIRMRMGHGDRQDAFEIIFSPATMLIQRIVAVNAAGTPTGFLQIRYSSRGGVTFPVAMTGTVQVINPDTANVSTEQFTMSLSRFRLNSGITAAQFLDDDALVSLG